HQRRELTRDRRGALPVAIRNSPPASATAALQNGCSPDATGADWPRISLGERAARARVLPRVGPDEEEDRQQVHVTARPHDPAGERLVVERVGAARGRRLRVVPVEGALREAQEHPEEGVLRGGGDEIEDLEARIQAPPEPGRRLDDRPPEEHRRPEKRRVLKDVELEVPDRGLVEERQVPGPQGPDVEGPRDRQTRQRPEGPAERPPSREGPRRGPARPPGKPPEDDGQGIAEAE